MDEEFFRFLDMCMGPHSSSRRDSDVVRPPRSSSPAGQGFERPTREAKILCYGDSLTAGYYSMGKGFEPYGATLKDILNNSGAQGFRCDVRSEGLVGLMARELVAGLRSPMITDVCGRCGKGLAVHLTEQHPDLVVIMAGTNDIGRGVEPGRIVDDIATLHTVCHRRSIKTVAMAPPTMATGPFRAGQHAVVRLLERWAREEPLCMAFIDPEVLVPHAVGQSEERHWDHDGIHLRPQGSRALGLRLAPHIRPLVGAELGLPLGDMSSRQPSDRGKGRGRGRGIPPNPTPVDVQLYNQCAILCG